MERDFNYFVEKYGESGAREKFEDACYTMLKGKYQENVYKVKGNPGDEGIDIYVGNITNKIDVYQCKFFMKRLDYYQIKNSFLRAVNNKEKFSMKSWTLLIPQDLTFKERSKWDEWKTQMGAEYNIYIKIMDRSAIINYMKQSDVYNQVFDIKPLMQLEEIYNKIQIISDSKMSKDFNFIIEKVREFISHRINVFKKLYYNSYDIREYFKKRNITSFLELFQQSDIHIQFLFKDIDNLLKEIRKYDKEIGFLCERFVFMQGVFINKIEEDIQYSDEYLFSLKSYIFQVSLQKIIWDLSVEEQRIKQIIIGDTQSDCLLNEFDMRDTIVVYKNKEDILRSLALHVMKIKETLSLEDFDVFYGRDDKKELNFSLIYPNIIFSGLNTPYPTSISKMIAYIDKSNSKINDDGEYTFHLHSNNSIFLEESEIKTLRKLQDIKRTANIKYHHFIHENRVDKFVKKLNDAKIDHKIISLVKEPKYTDKLEILLNNLKELQSEMITERMHDGSLVISNGTGLKIRKRKL